MDLSCLVSICFCCYTRRVVRVHLFSICNQHSHTSRHRCLHIDSSLRWMLKCEPVISQRNHRNSIQTDQDSWHQGPASKSVDVCTHTHTAHCFRVRWNLRCAHTGPPALNISLTINTAVIDVKLSQSERKGERGEERGKLDRKRDKKRKKAVHTKQQTRKLLILLLHNGSWGVSEYLKQEHFLFVMRTYDS